MNCANQTTTTMYESGVSHKLAKMRQKQIGKLSYDLHFKIPAKKDKAVKGSVSISVHVADIGKDLVLDFQNNKQNVLSVSLNSKPCSYIFDNQHIVISKSDLIKGENKVFIKFISGNSSLNRNNDFLYTLFVPDKASIVFPCFDQPDIKAKFKLQLDIPKEWLAVSNGKIVTDEADGNFRHLEFKQTKIISTYHFAFAAGKFQRLQRSKNGRTINFYHLEADTGKVNANVETLFEMHFMSLDWMEKYTDIKYPFDKLDFVSIPSFQFSGMEHVGAIYYRSSRMFLSSSASVEDIIKRASVIAHEVSHMWFGNLVTMRWFDDVWLKEVYAELFAAKMVHPMFPNTNHDVNFITANYPRAYQTDRTKGTHPIQQKLDNLNFAGTLYDDIIYFKSPIVMANLEQLIGEEAMQNGLREYLKTYSFGNAEWNDLINIFDKYTKFDLSEWSRMWVMQEGIPVIKADIDYSGNKIKSFTMSQNDPLNQDRLWKQNLNILFYKDGVSKNIPIYFDEENMVVDEAAGMEKPDLILLNGGAYGYGYFELDSSSKDFLLDSVYTISDDLCRTSAYISMFQSVVHYDLDAVTYVKSMMEALKHEKIKQNIQLILNNIELSWWFFIDEDVRSSCALDLETRLRQIAKSTDNKEVKSAVFETLVSVFISKETQDYFYNMWKDKKAFCSLKLTGTNCSKIVLALSVRDYPDADNMLKEQLKNIQNKERKAKLKFLMPAVSSDEKVRDTFFESLKNPKNRVQEIWVRTALYYLHHPLRAKYSVKYLPETLDMLEEIQQTGDIFFPKNWLAYSIGRYNTKEAAEVVNNFLLNHENYNSNLKSKILQLSDYMFRANKMRENK